MNKYVAVVLAAAATAYATPECPLDSPGSGNNIFLNPGFNDDLASWSTFVKTAGTTLEGSITSIAGSGGALFAVDTAGEEAWHMQIFQAFDIPVAGETYTLTFDLEAVDDDGGEAILFIQQTASPYTFFGREACAVGGEGTVTTCSVTAVIDDITAPVKFGIEGGGEEGLFLITGGATCLAPAATPPPVPAGPPVPTCPAGTVNLFTNPGFDGGLEPWGTFIKETDTSLVGSITDAGSGALFDIESSGQADWHMQISQIIPVPVAGQRYTLTFVMTAEDGEGGAGDSIIQQNGGNYPFFGRTRCSVGEPGGFGSTTVCTVSAVINDLTFPVKFGFQHEDARPDGGRYTLTGAALCGPPPSAATPAPMSVTPAPSAEGTAFPSLAPTTLAPEAVITTAPATGSSTCVDGSSDGNLFLNPGFTTGLAGWSWFVKATGTTLEGSITSADDGALFDVDTAGEEAWHMQIYQTFDIPVAGDTYTLTFDLEAVDDDGGEAIAYIQQNGAPWTFFGREACAVGGAGPTTTTCSVTAVIDDITTPVKFGIEGGEREGSFLIVGGATCVAPAATPTPAPIGAPGPPVPTCPAGTVNLFTNPGFDGGLEPWGTFIKETDTSLVGSITDAGSGALFDIESSGQADWHMQINQIIPVPVVGQRYTLTFVMTAEDGEGGAGDSIIQQNGGNYPFFGRTRCSVGEPGGFGSTTVCTVSAVINDLTFPVKFGFQHEDARPDGGRYTLTGAALCGPPPSAATPAPMSVTPAPSAEGTAFPSLAPTTLAPEAVITTAPISGPLNCPDGAELFTNEGFDAGLDAWDAYVNTEGTTLVGSITGVDSGALYNVQTAAPEDWHMQLFQALAIPVAGRVYSLSFQIAAVDAGEEREVEVYMQQNGGDYTAIGRQPCAVDTTGPTICDLSAIVDDVSLPVAFGIEDATSEGSFVVTGARLRSCSLEAAQFSG